MQTKFLVEQDEVGRWFWGIISSNDLLEVNDVKMSVVTFKHECEANKTTNSILALRAIRQVDLLGQKTLFVFLFVLEPPPTLNALTHISVEFTGTLTIQLDPIGIFHSIPAVIGASAKTWSEWFFINSKRHIISRMRFRRI